jgi:glutamate 5-kinase
MISSHGRFDRGDAVRVLDEEGAELARGIAAYNSEDMQRLCLRRSEEIERILGYRYADEVIHRSDLVLTAS